MGAPHRMAILRMQFFQAICFSCCCCFLLRPCGGKWTFCPKQHKLYNNSAITTLIDTLTEDVSVIENKHLFILKTSPSVLFPSPCVVVCVCLNVTGSIPLRSTFGKCLLLYQTQLCLTKPSYVIGFVKQKSKETSRVSVCVRAYVRVCMPARLSGTTDLHTALVCLVI